MTPGPKKPGASYGQPTKQLARELALTHAVELVTSRRDDAAIVPANHPERIREALSKSDVPGDAEAAEWCDEHDLASWRSFRESSIGTRSATEITVAYLSGPEPENDLNVLLALGVRPENIWAFEVEKPAAKQGLAALRALQKRGVKFIPASIEDYFISTPRRFDIIYLDACGPLPSSNSGTARLLMTMFRHNALAPLGVLVSNFARPDVSAEEDLDRYAFLVGAYLYPKSFLEAPDGGSVDGPIANSFWFNTNPEALIDPAGDDDPITTASPDFWDEVKSNFDFYYGLFITRALMDMATIVAPTSRLVGGDLYKVAFASDLKAAAARGARFVKFNSLAFVEPDSDAHGQTASAADVGGGSAFEVDHDGDAIVDPDHFSLLWTLAACGAFETDENFGPTPEKVAKFLNRWRSDMAGKPAQTPFADLVAIYYAWRHDSSLWSEAMRRIADFPYRERMPFLCDVPTEEIGFYPAFAQLGYPAHPNVRETRRFRYVAEGRMTPMFMDVIAFDECRYVHDWLSALHLTPEDWSDPSTQLTFRFALDGIAKDKRWYGEDFLYGCHVVGESSAFPTSDLAPREDLSP
jgi:hypothetical protein